MLHISCAQILFVCQPYVYRNSQVYAEATLVVPLLVAIDARQPHLTARIHTADCDEIHQTV